MLIGIDASRALVARRTGTETYALCLIRALLASSGGGRRYRLYTNGQPPAGLFWPQGAAPEGTEVRAIPFPRLWTHLRLSLDMLRTRRRDALPGRPLVWQEAMRQIVHLLTR